MYYFLEVLSLRTVDHRMRIINKRVNGNKILYMVQSEQGCEWKEYSELVYNIGIIIKFQNQLKNRKNNIKTKNSKINSSNLNRKLAQVKQEVMTIDKKQVMRCASGQVENQIENCKNNMKQNSSRNSSTNIIRRSYIKQQMPTIDEVPMGCTSGQEVDPLDESKQIMNNSTNLIRSSTYTRQEAPNIDERQVMRCTSDKDADTWDGDKRITELIFLQAVQGTKILKFKVRYEDGTFKIMDNFTLRHYCHDLLIDFYEKNVRIC